MHDLHAHLLHPKWYPPRFIDALLRDFARRQQAAGNPKPLPVSRQLLRMMADDDGATTIAMMDRAGIEKRAILVLDWSVELGAAPSTIGDIHRDILGVCARYPDRLVGFAGVDPRRTDAVEIVQWACDELGARGLKLHPTSGWTLNDQRTYEVVSVAAERNLPTLVHVGKTVDVLSDANARPAPFLELAATFPESTFIAGHSGFDLWEYFVLHAEMVPPNVFFDISGWQERVRGDGQNVVDDLRRLSSAFPGRICFGTDSPFYSFNLLLAEQRWIERVEPVLRGEWVRFDDLFQHRGGVAELQPC